MDKKNKKKNGKSESNNITFINSKKFSKLILDNRKINDSIISFNLLILVCTFIYGSISGFFVGGFQILINAIKIPIIIFSLIYISLPIFYIFNLFTNKKIGIKQIAVVILSGFTITSLIMGAFAPVLLLFSISTGNVQFIVLLNTGIGVLAIFCGLVYIYHLFHNIHGNGNEYVPLLIGYFIIFFSAPQLLWAMRPYFHHIDGFIEPMKSNFYIEILKVAQSEPILTGILVVIFSVVGLLIIHNLIEEKNLVIIYKNEHEQKNARKKRSLKKTKEISNVRTKVTDTSAVTPHYEHRQQYPNYPYYPYQHSYNPYWYRNSHYNYNQK
jgi:hypothetical protein